MWLLPGQFRRWGTDWGRVATAVDKKAYWEAFGTYFSKQEEFEALLDSATKEKYAALVYNTYANTQDEMYFSWVAAPLPKFEIKFNAVWAVLTPMFGDINLFIIRTPKTIWILHKNVPQYCSKRYRGP